MEIDVLHVLDEMDKVRRNHYFDKYPTPDNLCRILEAIVARAGGYTSRADWTDDLKKLPDSAYNRDYSDPAKWGTF